MAEPNGSGGIDDHEERIKRLKAARKEIEDALVVMSHLESKAAARVKEHAQFIAEHEQAMQSYEKRMGTQEERSRILDERVDKLVLAIGEWISRLPPPSPTT
jgi:chromosome segregation ATPase